MTPSERAALAEQKRLAKTGGSPPSPGEAPVMPGPPPSAPSEPDERTPWWVWALAAAVVIFLIGIGVYIATNRGDADPQPAPPPTAAPTTITSPEPTPEPTTEAPAPTEEELAFEAAQQRYRDFLPVFAEATVNWDATKLSGTWLTVDLAQFFVNDFARFQDLRDAEETLRWTQDVQSIEPVSYTAGEEYIIRVCAITNARFIDAAGTDVTVNRDGDPSPINTQARAKDIHMSWDGEQWRLAGFMQASDEGEPC